MNRTKHPNLHTFGRLLGFLHPYRWSLIVSIFLAVGSQAIAILLVRITQGVIDTAIKPQDERMLWIFIGVILGLGLVRSLLMVGRRFISGRQALGVEYDMRNALYAHLLRLSFGFYDRNQTGQLMSRATVDLQAVRFFLGYGLIFFFQHVLTIVGVTAIMFWTDWRLALVALAITPIVVALAYRYSQVSHPILRDVQQKMADVATVAEENIVGVHVVKSFAQETQEQKKFQRRSEALFRQSIRANRQQSFYVPILSFVPLLAQAAILLVGGWMVVHGSLTIGEFFAFNLYVTMLILPLRMLGMWIGQSQRATASGERIFQILDEPEDDRREARCTRAPTWARAHRASRASRSATTPSGSSSTASTSRSSRIKRRGHRPHRFGKDDVDRARAALLRRDGRARPDRRRGRPRRDARLAPLADRGHLAGSVPLLDDRAGQHRLRHGRRRRTRRSSRPRGWRRRTSSSSRCPTATTPSSASAGSRSRAASASGSRSRARSSLNPRILILDDATASVDATTEARIRLGLREAMHGRTTLIIAHRLSTISLADEVVVLDHGRIAARGTQAELAESSPVYREIYEHGLSTASWPRGWRRRRDGTETARSARHTCGARR